MDFEMTAMAANSVKRLIVTDKLCRLVLNLTIWKKIFNSVLQP